MHGFIFVVDSTDPERLSEAKDALKEFLRSDKARGKPVLLLCNKTDVETAEEMDVVVDTLQLEVGLCRALNLNVVECGDCRKCIARSPTTCSGRWLVIRSYHTNSLQ